MGGNRNGSQQLKQDSQSKLRYWDEEKSLAGQILGQGLTEAGGGETRLEASMYTRSVFMYRSMAKSQRTVKGTRVQLSKETGNTESEHRASTD